jgi:light-regulated signal transduction histidine kinase (bacteriophytochrome)
LWVIIEGYHHERERLGESRAEIRMLNSELEARVRERTAELERALGEIESFSYTVSHDLRAPLRAIDGFSSLVVESSAGRLDEESQRLLGVVRKNAQHMARLIDDLLAFSRAGRSELRRLRVDLTELARSAFAELTTGAPATPVELRLAPVPEAFGDPALLRQVLANLLSNALKFTAKVDRPVIELGAVASSGDTAYFVRDNGAGFDMAFANQLFGVFHRLHGADEFEGTGVGLAIVRRIVERHGGRVWAEGRVGEGATFYFTLAPPAPSAGATVPAAQ